MWKRMVASGAALCMLAVGLAARPAWADICDDYRNDPDLYAAAGCGTTTTADTFANNLITVVLSLVGVIAIGVIIYGGILYVISTGESNKVQRAKHAIMYGVIGLAVCLLAYAIVYFVGRAANG